ncbi:MAG: outer membrane protein assembly factor BamA [Candidatus Tectomicrobia bacterium]|uniref:Outer membrane protein assembly factor BamA n=1 Tax=Tectimicrobiota bacterium TaxID=2528274 RepID=A0A933GMX8_UNCTE|nr:outer membrane protein assembly factor BamA [Candidatus Tectomicrobia bacterium]
MLLRQVFFDKEILKFLAFTLSAILALISMDFFPSLSMGQEVTETSQKDQAGEAKLKIGQIIIKGARKVKRKDIIKVMSKKAPTLKDLFRTKPEFEEEILTEDIQNIKKLYWTAGYYSVQVAHYWKTSEENLVTIYIDIMEGEPTLIKDFVLEIKEEEIKSLEEKILKEIPLKVNKPFVLDNYERAKEIIYQYLADKGYPLTSVEGETKVDEENKEAHITFRVQPGPQAYIGRINIQGNLNVAEKVIRRELTFEEGQLFSQSKIQESQKKLYDTKLFKTAVISFDRAINEEHQIGILVKVVERTMRSFKFGVGYGTDDKLRGLVGWTHRNLGQRGGELEITGKASALTKEVEGNFRQPFFLDKNNQLLLSSLIEQETEPAFVLNKFGNKLRLSRKLTKTSEGFLGYNLEFNKLTEVGLITEETLQEIAADITLNSFISVGLRNDSSDNLFYPTKGNVESLVVEVSSGYLGSQENYLKAKTDLKGYYELVDKVILAGKLSLGLIYPFDAARDIPLFVHFFSGGSNSIRGYPYQKLGPLDQQGLPRGGNSLLESSLEIRFPIWNKIHGVVFADAGSLTRELLNYPLNDLKYAVGLGLRYQTIIGPVRIDVGHALNPEIPIDKYRLHLSIGQAF